MREELQRTKDKNVNLQSDLKKEQQINFERSNLLKEQEQELLNLSSELKNNNLILTNLKDEIKSLTALKSKYEKEIKNLNDSISSLKDNFDAKNKHTNELLKIHKNASRDVQKEIITLGERLKSYQAENSGIKKTLQEFYDQNFSMEMKYKALNKDFIRVSKENKILSRELTSLKSKTVAKVELNATTLKKELVDERSKNAFLTKEIERYKRKEGVKKWEQ